MRFSEWFDTVRQDAAVAFRAFTCNPGFTATAVPTLALGMGASTAICRLINSAMLTRWTGAGALAPSSTFRSTMRPRST